MPNRILKFSAAWCAPCGQLAAEMEKLGEEIQWSDINIDDPVGMTLAKDFGIRSIPTLIFLDENEREYTRKTGFVSAEKIQELYGAE